MSQETTGSIRHAELAAAMQFVKFALNVASSYDQTQPDHRRASVRTALVGVIRLIGELFPNEPALPTSLNHLLYGLWDLDRGKVVPLLEPAVPSKNPGLSLSEDLFRALPAAAMTLLMNAKGMKRSDAAHEIARRLTKMGYAHSSGDQYKGAQIAKWRDKLLSKKFTIRDGETERKLSLPAANVLAHAIKGAKGDVRSARLFLSHLIQMGLLEDRGLESIESTTLRDPDMRAWPIPQRRKRRPSDGLFEHLDLDLLSQNEQLDLSRLAEVVDNADGDFTALSATDFERIKYIVNKGRRNGITAH